MKFSRILPLLTLLAVAPLIAADSPNALTDAEKAAGWKLLFDGMSTAGWLGLGGKPFPASGWIVEDGTLKHTKGGGDIVTAEAYENFELSWDWKIAKGGNSGVKYNLPVATKNVGFEYQLLDDENHPDAKAREGRRQTGGLYDLLQTAAKKLNPPGEWNTSRIVVAGNKVEHWLNGAKTVEFEMGSEALKTAIAGSKYAKIAKFGEKAKSPILLQDHGDEIAFRAVKLRVLP
jgi:hypothetical protein